MHKKNGKQEILFQNGRIYGIGPIGIICLSFFCYDTKIHEFSNEITNKNERNYIFYFP
jgi:hypothetical protein